MKGLIILAAFSLFIIGIISLTHKEIILFSVFWCTSLILTAIMYIINEIEHLNNKIK